MFPYVSLCGRERNYVRCEDLPIVFTHITGNDILYGHAGDLLKELFKPDMVGNLQSLYL